MPKSEDPEPTGDPEEPSAATPESDSRTLSSGESSEDEKEAAEEDAVSILPSSVLDKASVIAQHFTTSVRRSSLAQDICSPGAASPRLPSRTISSPCLGADPTGRPVRLSSVGSAPTEALGSTDLTLLSPGEDNLFDADCGLQRRRDSILSRQDQLLIGKIKSYYENAGGECATVSLQRRESLTYIPTGLVRSSVSRFNSIPKEEHLTNSSSSISSCPLNPQPPQMASRDCLDPEDPGLLRSDSGPHKEDEEFRPSSEMLRVWQAMEQQISRCEDKDSPQETSRNAPRVGPPTFMKSSTSTCCQEKDASHLSAMDDPQSPSALFTHTGTGGLKMPAVPLVTQPTAEGPGRDSIQLDDKLDSKVLHLARQYSQRIKTTKPVVRQRSQGLLVPKNSLACVVEETEASGMFFIISLSVFG